MPGLARRDLDLLRFASEFGDELDKRARRLVQTPFVGRAEDDAHTRFAQGKVLIAADLDVGEAGLDIAEPLGQTALGKVRQEGSCP